MSSCSSGSMEADGGRAGRVLLLAVGDAHQRQGLLDGDLHVLYAYVSVYIRVIGGSTASHLLSLASDGRRESHIRTHTYLDVGLIGSEVHAVEAPAQRTRLEEHRAAPDLNHLRM